MINPGPRPQAIQLNIKSFVFNGAYILKSYVNKPSGRENCLEVETTEMMSRSRIMLTVLVLVPYAHFDGYPSILNLPRVRFNIIDLVQTNLLQLFFNVILSLKSLITQQRSA